MEINRNLIIWLSLFCGCTSNPFWEDQRTSRLSISGTVIPENRVTDIPIYVWVDDLGISGQTDSEDVFSIDLLNLETGDGSLSGSVRVFYYIHNYKVRHSVLNITDGKFSTAQTDFDKDGRLLESVVLERLVTLDLVADDSWDRSAGDTLRIKLEMDIGGHGVSIFSHVKSVPHDYLPSGVLFSSGETGEAYFDQNDIDFLQRYDVEPGASIVWTYTIAPDGIAAPPGAYDVRPFVMIQQDEVPDDLILGLGVTGLDHISAQYLKIPMDMLEKSILIQ